MKNFLIWHYSLGIKKLFNIFINFLIFGWNYFSIGRFFRTLFSSWRRDVSRVYRKGLHPVLFLQALVENIFTRLVGAILKSFIIFFGLLFEFFVIFSFLLIFFFFVLAPGCFIFALIGILFFIIGSIKEGSIFITIFIPTFTILMFSLFSFQGNRRNFYDMTIFELSGEKWFERVLDRIGADKNINREIFLNPEKLQNFLRSLNLSQDEFSEILSFEIENQIENQTLKKFWSTSKLFSISPIGRYWSYAYTNHLDDYSTSLLITSKYQPKKFIKRENEFSELKKLLLRPSQNNVLLIGEPGVGRNSLIQDLARKIERQELGKPLDSKRLLELNIKEILTEDSTDSPSEIILEKLFTEATYAGNIILVLKDLHEYLNPEKDDISSVLSQFLELPTFQIIGTTTPEEFHLKIEKKTSIMKFFEKITLEEIGEKETLNVLLNKIKELEEEKIIFTYQSLREIVKLTDRYIKDSPFPEKALDILEEVILHWKNSPDETVTAEIVNKTLSAKFGIPLGEMENQENEKMLHLEEHLHQRVVGQNFAISQIAETMRRARIGMTDKGKPLGSFLFLGPTGVGKTESSKALASGYFGDEERMIRLDMSEYQLQNSIDRLIGSLETKTEGVLINKVKESPFSLLLLDEIEKAHPDILNLFLQILDEGFLTDAFGKKINFSNLIIIATSNVGSEIIKKSVRENKNPEEIKKELVNYATRKGIFKPEFINRFEGVIFFHPLTQKECTEITKLLLEKYSKKLKEQQNIGVTFEEDVVEIISKNSYEPEFGARAIDRYIKDKIEDRIVERIIAGEIKKGTDFVLKVSDLEI